MRTQKEIVDRVEEIKENDFFGFEVSDLVGYLEYEYAKPYIAPAISKSEWQCIPSDRQSILKQMQNYMSFAWEKANGFRGLSASRSMSHYSIWVWMLGDEKVFGDLDDYQYYGKDNLVKICEHYGWDAKQWDDGIRLNSEEELWKKQ